MDANYKNAGDASVDAFVDGMIRGEREHLAAFVFFVAADSNKRKALTDKNWWKLCHLLQRQGMRLARLSRRHEERF